MRAPDGRTFRPKTQADVNRDGRKADDILARRISRQPKIPEPVVTGGGFSVLGVAEVTSVASSMKHAASGLDTTLVTFEAPWSNGTPDGLLAPSEFVTITGNEVHLSEGWYDISVRVDVAFSNPANAPDSAQVATVNQGSGSDAPWSGYDEILVAVTRSGKRGWCAMLSRPITYMADGDWIQLEMHYTHTATVGSSCVGINGDPGIHWTIKKLT